MSNEMSYQGRLVSVVERKGGWTTILDGMKQVKVRNSELSAPVGGKANIPAKTAAKNSPKNTKAPKAKAEKQPKAPKAADAPARLVNPDLTRYTTSSEVTTASGRKAIDVGDEVANQLRGSDLADVYRAASTATGITQKALHERYDHLNPGMQRMNLGNLIRGAAGAQAREEAKAAKAAEREKAKAAKVAAKPKKSKGE